MKKQNSLLKLLAIWAVSLTCAPVLAEGPPPPLQGYFWDWDGAKWSPWGTSPAAMCEAAGTLPGMDGFAGKYENESVYFCNFGHSMRGSHNADCDWLDEAHTAARCDPFYYNIYTNIYRYQCPDGKVIWPGHENKGCLTPIDIFKISLESPSCAGQFNYKNPILPMTGAKRETVGTGFSLGSQELQLVYDSTGRSLKTSLWGTNFSKKLTVNTMVGGSGVLIADRGVGKWASYILENGGTGYGIQVA